MSSAAFCQWRSKYWSMDAGLLSEMKHLQAENAGLKGIVKLPAIFATIVRRWISSSLQLTRNVVPNPMGVGSSSSVRSG